MKIFRYIVLIGLIGFIFHQYLQLSIITKREKFITNLYDQRTQMYRELSRLKDIDNQELKKLKVKSYSQFRTIAALKRKKITKSPKMYKEMVRKLMRARRIYMEKSNQMANNTFMLQSLHDCGLQKIRKRVRANVPLALKLRQFN